MKKQVWFWQMVLSPHMLYLAHELAKKGLDVHYVCREGISSQRKKLGWIVDDTDNLSIHIIKKDLEFKKLLLLAEGNSQHICSSIRANGYIGKLQKELKLQNKMFWVVMETVNPKGLKGFLKKLIYRSVFYNYKNNIKGVLAIGYNLPNWLISVGVDKSIIYPFSYFLKDSALSNIKHNFSDEIVRFIFVGNLIKLKQPDLILRVLSKLSDEEKNKYELLLVGGGYLESDLKKFSTENRLNVKFIGVVNINEVRLYMNSADCLLLPSTHDGWGAVVSESLIEGTRVICSNTCGSAGLIKNSGYGFTFDYTNEDELLLCVKKIISQGKINEHVRNEIKNWSKDLNVDYGSKYLYSILFDYNGMTPVWAKNCKFK